MGVSGRVRPLASTQCGWRAALARSARTTVSRVLNAQPGLKQKTIDRVQKALAETGFIPNAHALHLKGKLNSYGRLDEILKEVVAGIPENEEAHKEQAPAIFQHIMEKIFRKEILAAGPDPAAQAAVRQKLTAEYREQYANPYKAAELGYVDEVIKPEDTRPRVIRSLEMLRHKRQENPRKKHGNMPL